MLALSLADASEYEVDARLDAIVTALRLQPPGECDVEGRGDVEIGWTALQISLLRHQHSGGRHHQPAPSTALISDMIGPSIRERNALSGQAAPEEPCTNDRTLENTMALWHILMRVSFAWQGASGSFRLLHGTSFHYDSFIIPGQLLAAICCDTAHSYSFEQPSVCSIFDLVRNAILRTQRLRSGQAPQA